MIDRDKIKMLAEERIQELNNGCYLVDILVDGANRIKVEVDNEERGLSVDDCVSISRNIEHNLDRDEEDFSLEVTSPGLDQPFKTWRQYVKNIGRNVKVKTPDYKTVEGKLTKADDSGFEIEVHTKERVEGRKKKVKIVKNLAFKYDDIEETKIVIAFK